MTRQNVNIKFTYILKVDRPKRLRAADGDISNFDNLINVLFMRGGVHLAWALILTDAHTLWASFQAESGSKSLKCTGEGYEQHSLSVSDGEKIEKRTQVLNMPLKNILFDWAKHGQL